MAIVFNVNNSATRYENSSGTSVILPVPAGAQVDELLIAVVTHSTIADIVTIAGWTEVTAVISGTGTGSQSTKAWYRWVTGTESASYTWSTNATAGRINGIMVRVSGVDKTTPFDTTVSRISTATVTSAALPSVTTATANALLVSSMSLNASASVALVPPTEMGTLTTTTPAVAGTGRRTDIVAQTIATPGSTGTRTWTQSPTSTTLQYAGWMVALRPAAATTPVPVASFTATPVSGNTPLAVQFTDTSTNTPTSWAWTFGDGTTSTAQNPSKTYSTAGTYTVSLTATNAGGSNTSTRTSLISATTPPAGPVTPVAAFTSNVTSGSVPLTVQFTDQSNNVPTSWAWTFGDGTTSTQQSPSKTYNAVGTYTVALTASNAAGSNTVTKTSYITVTNTPNPTTPQGLTGSWTLDFHDEFDGPTLDTTKWSPNRYGQTAGSFTKDEPFNTNLNGAGYITEAAYFDPANVSVSDGAANFTITNNPTTLNTRQYPFASGMLSSEGKYYVPNNSYVEARIYVPAGDGTDGTGLWPAFWLTPTGQWPPEIDAFEFFNTADTVSPNAADAQYPKFNYHYGTSANHLQTGSKKYGVTTTDYRGSWHTYGILRTAGNATPYVDGVAYPSVGATGMADDLDQFIMLNLSSYREWYGAMCAPRDGAQMKVDWVRVWKTAATAPTVLSRITGIGGNFSIKTSGTSSIRVKVGTNAAVTQGVKYSAFVTPNTQGWAKTNIAGLTAGTTYYYRVGMIDANGVEQYDTGTVGTFKTAPVGQSNFSFSFGACTNATDSASLAAIAARSDDLFIHLGDLWYADATGTTIANYRTQMNAKLTAPNHMSVFSTRPLVYTPSDHDFSMNNNNTGLADTVARDNYNIAYREMIPSPAIPATSGVYYTFVWGRVRFISMDTRTFKSNQADTDNSSKTALGSVQKQWLKDTITAATEPVIVLLSEAPWIGAATAGDDGWFGYTTERTELANFFANSGKKIAMLCGDMHAVAADNGTNAPGGIAVFHAAPMNNNSSVKGGNYSAGVYPASGTSVVQQYGRVVVTDTGTQISLAFNGYSSDNTSRVALTMNYAAASASGPTFYRKVGSVLGAFRKSGSVLGVFRKN